MLSPLVNIKQQDLQRPENRPADLRATQHRLNVTTELVESSNLRRSQIIPNPLHIQEERKQIKELNLKKSTILEFQGLYTSDQIMFRSIGNLFLHNHESPAPEMLEKDI